MPDITTERLIDEAAARFHARDFVNAARVVESALALQPRNVRALCIQAIIAAESGQKDLALQVIGRAIELAPSSPPVINNAAAIFFQFGEPGRAIQMWQQLAAGGGSEAVDATFNLALSSMRLGNLDEAEQYFRNVMRLQPNHHNVHMNLGNLVKNTGRIQEAMAIFRQGVKQHPEHLWNQNNLLFGMHFDPAMTATEIAQEHAKWGRNFESNILVTGPFTNTRQPNRRLRVGYVSPNFCDHAVANFLLPILAHHDKTNVEVYCYNDTHQPDEFTTRMRGFSDVWRDTNRIGDAELAAVIHKDQIDILVDLVMHTEGSRLEVFARRPAPIQVAWLAYPGSTGLSRMDYRLTDPFLDPPHKTDHLYTERSVRLESFGCYDPLQTELTVGPLPADTGGYITFGCLNNFAKVNDQVLETWRDILNAVPTSKLIILPPGGITAQRVLKVLGVDPERIDMRPRGSREEYLALYNQIDFALDPFPWVGLTTTLDGLWMGVPVVSLSGQTAVSRGSLSILSNLGLEDLCVSTRADYVALAIKLTADLPRLRELRRTLRDRLQTSVLMDGDRFTRKLEAAYRTMWQAWC